MVVGEPGIGKTTICDQLATYVTLRGGRTLRGNCYEEGSLSLPYLPFVEAMRSYVLERDSEDLRRELGSGATFSARELEDVPCQKWYKYSDRGSDPGHGLNQPEVID